MPSKTEQRLAALHLVDAQVIHRITFAGFSQQRGDLLVPVTPQQTRALNYLVGHRLALPDLSDGVVRLLRLTTAGEATLIEWSA